MDVDNRKYVSYCVGGNNNNNKLNLKKKNKKRQNKFENPCPRLTFFHWEDGGN